MKITLKKFVALFLIICLCFSNVMMSFASSFSPDYSIDIAKYSAMSDDELKTLFIEKYGLSESDASELVFLKNKAESEQLTNNIALYGSLPTDAEIGDTYWMDYYINFDTISDTSDVFNSLVKAGVPAVAASVIAAGIFLEMTQGEKHNSVHVRVEYYYGPNNDGVVMWNYRRVEWGWNA